MAEQKTLKTRIQSKHDTQANWTTAGNASNPFIPLKGEIIIYDPDSTYSYPRIKVGNGTDNINQLPFITSGVDTTIRSINVDLQNLDNYKADKATTLAGYGITDAKIENGSITLGTETITPITSHQDISDKQDKITSTNKLAASLVSGLATVATSGSYNDLSNKPTIDNNNQKVQVTNGTTTTTFGANDSVSLVAGSNVTITPDATNKKITIASTNTTYGVATTSANGLMSSTDKTKLNGIAEGATKVTSSTVSGWGFKTTDNNTSHSHSAGVGLTGSGNAGTSSGTYTYKVALADETLDTNASVSRPSANANRTYPVIADKNGKLATIIPWTDTNTTYTFTTNNPTLSWGTTSTIGTAGGTTYKVTMPGNPNTWRGIQNNLTSTSTSDSLSAYQGKVLNDKFSSYLPLSGGTMNSGSTVRFDGNGGLIDAPDGYLKIYALNGISLNGGVVTIDSLADDTRTDAQPVGVDHHGELCVLSSSGGMTMDTLWSGSDAGGMGMLERNLTLSANPLNYKFLLIKAADVFNSDYYSFTMLPHTNPYQIFTSGTSEADIYIRFEARLTTSNTFNWICLSNACDMTIEAIYGIK